MKWHAQAAPPETRKTRAGRLCFRPLNQMGTTQNTASLSALKCVSLSRILKMYRSNYLILWLSPAMSCCMLPPGRRMKGRLFSRLQNTVVRYVIMLGTLEGPFEWKGKTRACLICYLGVFSLVWAWQTPTDADTAKRGAPTADLELELFPSSAPTCPPTPTASSFSGTLLMLGNHCHLVPATQALGLW